ncbi:hypothetical protein C8F01DRAFT_1162077 [Mycena amicta]|nr:hypothetical protein C8F01DRAFT_1162077 [Mycena amicta]
MTTAAILLPSLSDWAQGIVSASLLHAITKNQTLLDGAFERFFAPNQSATLSFNGVSVSQPWYKSWLYALGNASCATGKAVVTFSSVFQATTYDPVFKKAPGWSGKLRLRSIMCWRQFVLVSQVGTATFVPSQLCPPHELLGYCGSSVASPGSVSDAITDPRRVVQLSQVVPEELFNVSQVY